LNSISPSENSKRNLKKTPGEGNSNIFFSPDIFFSFTLHRTGVIELLLVQKKLVEVIQARASNIGNGNLYVATLLNPIPLVEVTKYINMNSFKN
jgi:hypothetical protein